MPEPESNNKPSTNQKSFVHKDQISAWVDGSYRPEGNAAYGYLIYSEKNKSVLKMERYACRGATINQMELQAVNKVLDHPNSDYLMIYSDSAYVISCLTLWYKTWERHNWTTPLGQPVKNKDLIVEILAKIKRKKYVRFSKVRAHSGDPFNSVVDFLVQELSFKMREDPAIPNGRYVR